MDSTKWQLGTVRAAGRKMIRIRYRSNVLVGILAAICSGEIIAAADCELHDAHVVIGLFPINLFSDDYTLTLGLRALIASAIIYTVLRVLVLNPLFVWTRKHYLSIYEYEVESVAISNDFKRYGNIVKTMLLVDVVCIVYTLLLIVPGVVKRYSLFAVPYILAENPMVNCRSALTMSENIMTNNKMGIFKLELSFVGWMLLGTLSLGLVNIFYTNPYMYCAETVAYRQISSGAKAE